MKTIGIYVRPFLLSIAFAAGSLSIASAANAALQYSGLAEIEFTGINVCAGQGQCNGVNTLGNNYTVSSVASIFDSGFSQSGDGFADFFISLLPTADWAIDDSFYQTSESYGDAGLSPNASGIASSFADTDFAILFENRSHGQSLGGPTLRFDLLFTAFVSADIIFQNTVGSFSDGGAYAAITLFDLLDNELFFSSAEAFIGGPLVDSNFQEITLSFILEPGQSKTILGNVYSDGYAEVAAPPAVWLMGIGLMGISLFARKTAHRSRVNSQNMQ